MILGVSGRVFLSSYLFWKLWGKPWYVWFAGVIIILFIFLAGTLFGPGRGARIPGRRNLLRERDIRQVQLALELYYDDHRMYPPISDGCTELGDFESYLVPQYASSVPRDPLGGNRPAYQGAISGDRQSYVLKVELEDRGFLFGDEQTDAIVKSGKRGEILGCSCEGLSYCVGPLP